FFGLGFSVYRRPALQAPEVETVIDMVGQSPLIGKPLDMLRSLDDPEFLSLPQEFDYKGALIGAQPTHGIPFVNPPGAVLRPSRGILKIVLGQRLLLWLRRCNRPRPLHGLFGRRG